MASRINTRTLSTLRVTAITGSVHPPPQKILVTLTPVDGEDMEDDSGFVLGKHGDFGRQRQPNGKSFYICRLRPGPHPPAYLEAKFRIKKNKRQRLARFKLRLQAEDDDLAQLPPLEVGPFEVVSKPDKKAMVSVREALEASERRVQEGGEESCHVDLNEEEGEERIRNMTTEELFDFVEECIEVEEEEEEQETEEAIEFADNCMNLEGSGPYRSLSTSPEGDDPTHCSNASPSSTAPTYRDLSVVDGHARVSPLCERSHAVPNGEHQWRSLSALPICPMPIKEECGLDSAKHMNESEATDDEVDQDVVNAVKELLIRRLKRLAK